MLQFRLFGIPIGVHWMFALLTVFLGGGLSAKGPEAWRGVIVFMIAAFISILVHDGGYQPHLGALQSVSHPAP